MTYKNIRDFFTEHENTCSCKEYYCSTCGGIASAISDLTNIKQIKSSLYEIESLSVGSNDFNRKREGWFPRKEQCSNYILFLRDLVSQLQQEEQAELIKKWAKSASHMSDEVLDGIGYYVVPHHHKKIWQPFLIEKAASNESIKETLRIKYKAF